MYHCPLCRTFARHHETGQILPRDLVTKMIDAKRFGRGMWLASQTMYAKVSLWYHGTGPHFDLNQLYQSAWERATPVPFMKNNHFPYAFGHLEMQGPKYYTYLWSSVIGKDLFTEFDADDLLDPTPALRYKKMILAPGSSIPAAQLVRNFLGLLLSTSAPAHYRSTPDLLTLAAPLASAYCSLACVRTWNPTPYLSPPMSLAQPVPPRTLIVPTPYNRLSLLPNPRAYCGAYWGLYGGAMGGGGGRHLGGN